MADEPNLEKNDGAIDEAAINAKIQAAVEEATAALKANNKALKDEKTAEASKLKELNDAITGLGGIEILKQLGNADTVKQLADMRKRFENDASSKLLSEGKYDEWFDNRVSGLRKDHDAAIGNLQKALDDATKTGEVTTSSLRAKILENEVTNSAAKSGVIPGALMDVLLRAQRLWKFDQEYDGFVLRDRNGGLVFGKDGKSPKTMIEWLDDQKEDSSHWWPGSRGGGAGGSDSLSMGSKDELSEMDFVEFAKERRKNGFKSH